MNMRRIRSIALGTGVAMLLGGLATAVPASAETNVPPTVTSFTQSAATVQVSGSNSVPVSFDVGLQGVVNGGWCDAGSYSYWSNIRVQLRRASDTTVVEAPVVRVDGTDAEGVWRGSWWVDASDAGTWTVIGVTGCFPGGMPGPSWTVPVLVGGTAPSLVVAGTHALRLIVTPPGTVVYGGSMGWSGRVVDVDTGRGVPGVALRLGEEINCLWDNVSSRVVRTDATGRFRWVQPDAGPQPSFCVFLLVPNRANPQIDRNTALVAYTTFAPRWISHVTVAAPRAPVARGRTVVVTGAVHPSARRSVTVVLQARAGSRWRTVARTSTTSLHRYAFAWRAASKGTWQYRVVATQPPGAVVGPGSAGFTLRIV